MIKYKKILNLIFIIIIINTNFILNISAQTINNAEETDKIDQEQNQFNTAKLIYNQNQIAQSFSPTLPKITKIKLFLAKQGNISSDFILIIKEKITGPNIAEVSVSSENIPNIQPQWIEFNFTDIPSDSELYYFLCKTNSGDQNNYYEIYCVTQNSYKDGIAYLTDNNGNTWLQDNNIDFTFKTYGAGPILNIEFIRGLSGGTISIGLKNIGTSNADNIKITAIFTGGIMFKKYFEVYPNTSLEPNNMVIAEISPIIGFGHTTLEIYIYANNADILETQKDVFILLFYTYIRKD